MLLQIRGSIFVLKEASSFLKIFNLSKNCYSSVVGEAKKHRENNEENSLKNGSREYRGSKRYDFDSSYSSGRYGQKRFPFWKNNPTKYHSTWQKQLQNPVYEDSLSEETENLPFEKFFYVEHADVTNRSLADVQDYRTRMNITIDGTNVPKPITKFSELCLPENLTQILKQENYSEPTPIQAQGWPVALSGRDMIGVSQTGSGKTLAYMLPGIVHAVNQFQYEKKKEKYMFSCKPRVLVLGPTRELIQQIHHVSKAFIEACGLSGATVYGGASKHYQLRCLEGAEICIATPGRLLDFLSCKDVSLRNCSYLVLDEADRMLDMGFEPQIRAIIDQIQPDRQTLMWSATWPSEIRNLAKEFLNDFIHITIGSGELVANPNIEQKICVMTEHEKEERLISLLNDLIQQKNQKALVFAQTKRKVDYLCDLLSIKGIPTLGIHGDISQTKRDKILNCFRMNKSCVLIATDVAARGLDITDIQHVVNFDFPLNIEDYIHRIGRTARGSSSGVAHSFFTIENSSLLKDLFSVLRKSNQEINADLLSLADSRQMHSKFSNKTRYRRSYY